MGVKFLRALAAFVKYPAKLAIVVGWYYLVVNLPALNVWLALTVWALVVADFWLWLCHSHYCETPRWFDWFPPGVGFYCWWMMRPRKERKS